MKLGHSIRHGTKWLLTGNIGGQALQFAFGIALARLLTPADFGLLVTIQIFTGFVGMVASGGMGEALVQARDVKEDDYQTVFTFQLAVGVLIYAGFFLIAPWFALWFNEPLYESLLRVSALSFLFRPFANNPHIRLRRAMRFKEVALVNFSNIIIVSSLSIGFALAGFGVWGLVLSGLLGIPFNIAVLSWRAPWRPSITYNHVSARTLQGYGFKSIANDLLIYFRNQTNNFIISKSMGADDVGLFNKGHSLARMPVGLIAGSAYQTVFRALSKVQDDLPQSRYIYLRTITLVSLYTLPVYLALGAVARPFVVGVFGPHWEGAAGPLLILCLGAPAYHLEVISGALVAARNRLAQESWLQFQTWMLFIAGGLIGLRFGLNGLAWSTVVVSYYIGIRLTLLALDSIGYRFTNVLAALRPVLVLLIVEGAVLVVAIALLRVVPARVPELVQALFVASSGLSAAGLLFLFWPDAKLRAEANRWREKIRLDPLTDKP